MVDAHGAFHFRGYFCSGVHYSERPAYFRVSPDGQPIPIAHRQDRRNCPPGAILDRMLLRERPKSYGEKIVVESLELLTERLRLRMPQIDDADAIQSMVADPRVALTTASIPHPYPEGGAKGFILHVRKLASRDRRNLVIVLREGNELIGMVGYQTKDLESELAYMVSPIHWGLGYASEACREIIAHIFNATEAKAVVARAMADNKASEAVLRKAGLRWQREMPVELPIRSGTFISSFWRLSREEFQNH